MKNRKMVCVKMPFLENLSSDPGNRAGSNAGSGDKRANDLVCHDSQGSNYCNLLCSLHFYRLFSL